MTERAAFRPVRLTLPDFDPRLRAQGDEDPIVEEMVERLRRGLGGMVAVDGWGRPLSWRDVVRTALGTSLMELRDARTARALAAAVEERLSVRPSGVEPLPAPKHAAPGAAGLPEPAGP